MAEHPVRILVATDAAREGINLQAHCADLFHWDVPWNPARMEQRNGRIDRTLQPEPEVRCMYFSYEQRTEDRVLDHQVQRSGALGELAALKSLASTGSFEWFSTKRQFRRYAMWWKTYLGPTAGMVAMRAYQEFR